MRAPLSHKGGFTLVELSIVLVIIGLIVGGVLVGRDLVRTAELESIAADANKFSTAMNTFKDKYGALPGDMPNATNYWGSNPNCATYGAGTGTETCNGDGNGMIGIAPYYATNQEVMLAWQHLANAGMIAGQFTGGGPNYYACTAGVNCPSGKPGNVYYVVSWRTEWGGSDGWWSLPYNIFLFVGQPPNPNTGYPLFPFLTPREALAFDLKMDDGKPGTGTWVSALPGGYTPNCAIDTATGGGVPDGSPASEQTSVYNVNYAGGRACAFMVNLHL